MTRFPWIFSLFLMDVLRTEPKILCTELYPPNPLEFLIFKVINFDHPAIRHLQSWCLYSGIASHRQFPVMGLWSGKLLFSVFSCWSLQCWLFSLFSFLLVRMKWWLPSYLHAGPEVCLFANTTRGRIGFVSISWWRCFLASGSLLWSAESTTKISSNPLDRYISQ